jgi:hypothetical protein
MNKATDPLVARHLNSLAESSSRCQEDAEALQYRRDALSILDWNRCNALLFDNHSSSREYALEMAITLRGIGDTMRRMNDFVGSAEAYKECLDLFLEGLIDNGIALKTRLNELELQPDYDGNNGAVLDADTDVDLFAVGEALHGHPEYASSVAGISDLLREIQYAKFVSHSASSRRRRRMNQRRAADNNMKRALESLSMSTEEEHPIKDISVLEQVTKPSLKRSTSMPDTELSSKPSLIRRAVTSTDDFNNRYDDISTFLEPVEKALVVALKRFPAPPSVENAESAEEAKPSSDKDSQKLPFANGTKSPRSVGKVYDCSDDPPPHLLEYIL